MTTNLCKLWLGLWGDQTVAIKKLKASSQLHLADGLAATTRDVLSTFEAAGPTNHPNIVEILGVTWSKALNFSVVMSYAESGDLRSLLDSDMALDLTWPEPKCQLAIDIVDALVFLEAHEATICPHASRVSSRNILLHDKGTAQLSLVQWGFEDLWTFSPEASTLRYVAPEILVGEKVTTSASIYSLGILLVELDTTRLPFDDVVNPNGSKASTSLILSLIAKRVLQPTPTPECPEGIVSLIHQCLAWETIERPNAQQVAYTLRSILKDDL